MYRTYPFALAIYDDTLVKTVDQLHQNQKLLGLVSWLLGLSAVVLTTSGDLKAMLQLLTLAAVAYVASRVIFPREIAETAHEKELEQEEMQAKPAAPAPEEKEEKHEEN